MCSIANEVIQVRKIYKASSWTNKGNTERYEACSELFVGSFLWVLDPCFSLKWQNLSRFISHFMIEYHVSMCLVIDLCICIFLKNHYEYFSRCLRKGVLHAALWCRFPWCLPVFSEIFVSLFIIRSTIISGEWECRRQQIFFL